MSTRHSLRVVAIALLGLTTGACGLKGDLYLPEPPVAEASDADDVPAEAPNAEQPQGE